MQEDLFCFLYHSKIAPDVGVSCVAEIVKTARSFNKEHQITGMLVFDGQRFCQYIEGPRQDLQALIDRIEVDARHHQFEPKHHAPLNGKRMFSNWSMAYVLVDDAEPLDDLERVVGPAAIEILESLIPMLDIA